MAIRINTTIEEFSDPVRRGQIAREVLAFVRKWASDVVGDTPDADLLPMIRGSIICGDDLDIRTMAGFKRFGLLWVLSDGAIGKSPDAMEFIRYGGINADGQVEALMRHTADAVRKGKPPVDAWR
jgi:hypothetical protein